MKKRDSISSIVGRESIHPFPARMAPGIALDALTSGRKPLRVLDPMMGSGTVLAVARSNGHKAIGVDIDPLAVLLGKVWTTPVDVDEVLEAAEQTLNDARELFKSTSIGNAYPQNADEETRKFIRYWFDGYARRQLSALSISISKVTDERIRNTLWCGFSRLIITKQSGASLARDLSHSRPHRAYETSPIKPFTKYIDAVTRVVENCIDNRAKSKGPSSRVYEGDARALPIKNNSIDLVLTSPPYLNAIDYMRCSKFSLVWMGYSVSRIREIRNVSVGSEARDRRLDCDGIAEQILKGLKLSPKLNDRNTSMLLRYIKDMMFSIREAVRVLVPNGQAVYVIGENNIRGTYIRNSEILSKVGEQLGLSLIDRKVRVLPANKRYMPPPSKTKLTSQMDLRMRREVVLTFCKS